MENRTIALNEDIAQFEIENFVNAGSESTVFRAKKKNVGRTYAFKFRKREGECYESFIDDEVGEINFYKQLDKCSVSKLAGIISDVPSDTFDEICQVCNKENKKNNDEVSSDYFCVIEDYISGCTLAEYREKYCPRKGASYDAILDYQEQIFNWIIQFCEIMEKFEIETGKKRILHLDIKPQNIMVTDQTKSLVLIDFNLSEETEYADKSNILYYYPGRQLMQGATFIGTQNYAAPEAYFYKDNRITPPPFDRKKDDNGNYVFQLDERSDIFSFGATLWVCVNPNIDISTFELPCTEDGYYKRDLYDVPAGYSQELEDIIVKCTQKDPKKRYQNFGELKKAAIKAKAKLPNERKKKISHILGSIFIVFSIISFCCGIFSTFMQFKSSGLMYEAKRLEFDEMAKSYSENRFSDFKDCASALIKADPNNKQSYKDILKVSYTDQSFTTITAPNDTEAYSISLREFIEILLPTLSNTNDPEIIQLYANKIIARAYPSSITRNAEAIYRESAFKELRDCDGFKLSEALCQCNDYPIESYETLQEYSKDEKTRKTYQKVRKTIASKLSSNLVSLEKIEQKYKNAKSFLDSIKQEEVLKNYELDELDK